MCTSLAPCWALYQHHLCQSSPSGAFQSSGVQSPNPEDEFGGWRLGWERPPSPRKSPRARVGGLHGDKVSLVQEETSPRAESPHSLVCRTRTETGRADGCVQAQLSPSHSDALLACPHIHVGLHYMHTHTYLECTSEYIDSRSICACMPTCVCTHLCPRVPTILLPSSWAVANTRTPAHARLHTNARRPFLSACTHVHWRGTCEYMCDHPLALGIHSLTAVP